MVVMGGVGIVGVPLRVAQLLLDLLLALSLQGGEEFFNLCVDGAHGVELFLNFEEVLRGRSLALLELGVHFRCEFYDK